MYGLRAVGVAYICYSCKGYNAYMPEVDIESSKHYMRRICPKCGAKLAIEQVEYKGY